MAKGSLTIRRARLGDEPVLREIRLQALSDGPAAFGSTYERELARTTADWQRWISTGVTLILEDSAVARGMVAGLHDADNPEVVHLMAMWVHPRIRGSGGADDLVAALIAWAQSEGAKSVQLKVIEGNARARRFYERNGFRYTGFEAMRLDGPIEIQMEQLVDQALRVKP